MKTPQGIEKHYPPSVLLKLLCTIYGFKQVALQFWREMHMVYCHMGYMTSEADLCPYHCWRAG